MNNEEQFQYIAKIAEDSAALRRLVGQSLAPDISELAGRISGVIGTGGKLLVCGNGGSAADSSHMAAEMIVRLTAQKNRQSLPAIALTTDSSVITASGNDFGFEHIFSRQVEGLGNKGDMLLLISTSGNSPNLIRAVQVAHELGLIASALLGGNGGKLAKLVDKALIVPHQSTQRIQEEQIFLIHLLVELIESDLCG
jgi:D-sedoheptulose 7-phosphate isomerase